MAKVQPLVTPIHAVEVLLHCQRDGWSIYINKKKAIAFDCHRALVEGTEEDEVEWVSLNTKTSVIIVKNRVACNIFRAGEIKNKIERPITASLEPERGWVIRFSDV